MSANPRARGRYVPRDGSAQWQIHLVARTDRHVRPSQSARAGPLSERAVASGGATSFVANLFKLGIDHVLLGLALPRTGIGRAARGTTGLARRAARATLARARRVGALRDATGRLTEGFELLLDRVLVVGLERGLQIRQRRLRLGTLLTADLVAQVLQRLLDLMDQAIGFTMRLISSSVSPLEARITMRCSLPVALSLADTLRMPLASMSKVTST
jgi:hypothetical protein